MLGVVEKVEEEEGVITVYFSSPYEIEFDTGAGYEPSKQPSHLRPVYTSAGPCMVAKKSKERQSKQNSRGKRGQLVSSCSLPRLGQPGKQHGRKKQVRALSSDRDVEWQFDPAPSPTLTPSGNSRPASRHISVQTPGPSPRADLSPKFDQRFSIPHNQSHLRLGDRPETSPIIPESRFKSKKKSGLISTEFTPAEWNINNVNKYKTADVIRHRSEAVRNLTSQLIEEHEDYARKGEEQAKYRLGERMRDVNFWLQELEQELSAVRKVTDDLSNSRRNADHALAQTDRPFRIYCKCKDLREKRIGIELVKDGVELALQSEADTIKQHQEILKAIVAESTLQIDRSFDMVQRLTSDLQNKEQAVSIEQATVDLAVLNKGPLPAPSTRNKDQFGDNSQRFREKENTDIPIRRIEEWAEDSKRTLQASQKCRKESASLIARIEAACGQAVSELKTAWESTNQALVNRVKETQDSKAKLQNHLSNVNQEIKDLEQHMEVLKSSIKAKQNPLSLAKARLAMRQKLPNQELCLDLPYIALKEEIGQLQASIETLNQAIVHSAQSHKELLDVKQTLEHDIFLKNNSLSIDRTKCLPLRNEFPFHLFCGCNKCKSCRTSLYCRTHTCKKV